MPSRSRPTTRACASLPERAESDSVAHGVASERAAFDRLEGMGVMPQGKRTFQCQVDEAVRWVPDDDLGPPADGTP